MVALARQAVITSASMGTAFAAISPVLGLLAATGAGLAIGNALSDFESSFAGINDEIARTDIENLEKLNRTLRDEIPAAIEESLGSISVFSDGLSASLQEAVDASNDLRGSISSISGTATTNFESALERFGSKRLELIKGVGDAIDDIDQQILDGSKQIKNVQQEILDFQFDRILRGADDDRKAVLELQRSGIQLAETFREIEQIDLSESSQKAAEEAAKLSVSYAKSALRAADATENVEAIAAAETRVREALNAQESVYRRINELRGDQQIGDLDAQRNALNKLNAEQQKDAKALAKQFAELQTAAQSGASELQLALLKSQLNKAIDAFRESLKEFDNQEIVNLLGFEDAADALTNNVSEGLKDIVIDWSRSVNALRDQLQDTQFQGVINLTTQIDEQSTAELRELFNEGVDVSIDPVAALQKRQEVLKETIREQVTLQQENVVLQNELNTALKKASEFGQEATQARILGDGGETLALALEPLADKLLEIGNLSEQELIKLNNALIKAKVVGAELTSGVFGDATTERVDAFRGTIEASLKAVETQIQLLRNQEVLDPEKLQESIQLLDLLKNTELDVNTEGVERANELLDRTSQNATKAAIQTAGIGRAGAIAQTSINSLTSTTGNLSSQANAAAQAFDRMAESARKAAEAANAANNSNSSGFAFRGEQVKYRANGGDSRGQDTIPTMLSPEEFVVNSQSARNFLPQLQAINANTGAVGGSNDTNITIGDINVTSNSQLPSQTAREVGISIKRELRRGTFKL